MITRISTPGSSRPPTPSPPQEPSERKSKHKWKLVVKFDQMIILAAEREKA